MGLSPVFTADQPVARSRSSNTATGQGCCCCWWCGHAPANTPLLEPEASASGLAPSTEPCDGWWPSWETRGCSRSSQRGGCVPAASAWQWAGPGWTHRGSRRLRGPHMKAPGDGPLLGRGVPTRTAGARGRKPGARRGLLGAGRVPWRAEPASPSRSASSPPRPCTQRWRPQSCGGHRGAVRPVPGEAPPLRPCPSVTRAGAGNSSAGRRGQRIIPGRSAPAWWAGEWGWTRPSSSADTPPSQLSASSSGPQETPRGLQRRRTAPPAGWLCSGPHSACVGGRGAASSAAPVSPPLRQGRVGVRVETAG